MSWDDGKHAKVKKVQLTFDDVIRSIEVEYEGTNLKSQRRGTVGTRSDGFTLSTDEYITSVSGYYKTTFSGDHITALTFKTNKKTYGPYGNKTQNYFSADAPKDSQIAGFLGTSGNALSSLDVHFAPIPTPGSIKPQPGGSGTGGGGSKPGGSGNESGGGGGGSKPGGSGNESGGGSSKPGGSGNESGGGGGGGSKPGGSGNESGGGGGSGNETGNDGPGKMGPLGGDKGNVFDDVGFEGVKKITVGADQYSVTYIKIEYIKDGQVVVREHGTVRGELKEFSVDYPNDSITAVSGTYKHIFTYDTTLITSLYFTTSKGFTSPLFGIDSEKKGTEFEFKGENGGKLLGFHGRGGNAIDAIGAYFDTGSQGGKGGDGSKTDVPGKKGPLGGDKGEEFNDVGFEGVKKITVGADQYSVTYIKIEYVKDGKVEIREHGTSRGELQEFSVDYPNDSITAVSGTYKRVYTYDTTLITSLYFTTSKGFTSPLFGINSEKKGTEFEFKGENGGKLIGLHGRGGNAIDAIGAYFDTGSQGGDGGDVPSKDGPNTDVPGKKGPLGGDKGEPFDDVGFEGVKKITVGVDNLSITYIKIEYVKDGKVEVREHGTARGKLQEFSVDYPNDSITEVAGTYKHNYTYDTTLITSLYFTTSKGFTSPLFGIDSEKKGTEFEFKDENGGKLIGFHGRGGNAIDAIGAYFDTGSKPGGNGDNGSGSNSGSSPQKLDAQGGKGGNQWDDSGDHDGVTKIHVAYSRVIEQIKFEYVKNGETKEGPAHGVKGGARTMIATFEISHPNEYLLSVKGWSDSSNKIVGIQFTTNTKTSDYYGFEKYPGDEGTDILLEVKDKKIVGFHGFADNQLNSLGAYFAPIASTPLKPSKKLQGVGGDEGASWDDGAFDGVKKIQVGQNNDGVSFVAVEYQNGSQKVVGDGHGKQSSLGVETFELADGEYITSVGVYYDKIHAEGRGVTVVTSLIFKTNKQISQPFGMTGGEYVELKEEGNKIVGFHGKASDWVHQIGVYVAPVTK
ncbi:myrosinase-binding protein 2 isoform X3 [Brassica rapa]|uniref:myrosinase-binding protein 2 isoform X3 n=1 Tax=Brassica campestris TaxID=3711 RepID=UPI00142E14EC|nr:myrosinase-binding protein 2 isoform X3 [Brassica rapa]